MKLKSLKKLHKYKSFQDFTWRRYFNAESFHDDINIIYGENGSGKSSICNILKNVCQLKSFEPYKPEEVCLVFDDGAYKYSSEDELWDKSLTQDSILFFDREFVSKNVHLGHTRGTQHGQQEQESGKMIIEFDSEAIKHRSERDRIKKEKDSIDEKVRLYRIEHEDDLYFSLNDDEKKLFRKFKDKKQEEIAVYKRKIKEKKKELENIVEVDSNAQMVVSRIKDIPELEFEEYYYEISDLVSYQEVFDFEIQEKVKIEAEKSLINKIKRGREFFEAGIDIRENNPNQCPFCQTKNEEEKIKSIISLYDNIYDNTYKVQKQNFFDAKELLVEELRGLLEEIEEFDISEIFLELKDLDEEYKIKGIYLVSEEKSFKKIPTKNIKKLLSKLSSIKSPSKEDVSILYEGAESECEILNKYYAKIAALIEKKNRLIIKYKGDNTNKKLQDRISKNIDAIDAIDTDMGFLNERKIQSQKKKEKRTKGLRLLEKKREEIKTNLRKAKLEYEKYCSQKAFAKLLKNIESYFKNFNFNFTLKLDTERRTTGSMKEYPFAFKVLDVKGGERDLKEGLSEGELQILSLCFFFAFLDIQKNKNKKILVFDDPITSLDNSNLSSLVELISKEQTKFSQTFIFSHNRTFFQFLRKKYKKRCGEFNILRNKEEFGGSFICKSVSKKFINKLKDFEKHLESIPPASIDIDLKIVEYGQYLRYEVERHIKNNLLHWNANDFPAAIDGVKVNKGLKDDDLEMFKKVYSFCNWTTSHVDIGDDHGLAQLKTKINDFVSAVKS